ncbi:MAG TPA: hypothetical protein VK735_18840 [Pseudonocardia sp.]|uniref:hypothetical protein n=1 Tax=Pseudonocardia sp. TaxID=60912 RepID=UPI002C03CDF4|nr:hypothetical protein [Pseudonocardia sp.]HTF49505.1 hypothetical protein [Pseudonocardia sp.]
MIRRQLARALPYLVAFAVPAASMTGWFAIGGAAVFPASVGGLLAGLVGLLGAACAGAVQARQDRRTIEHEIEELVTVVKEPLPVHDHEGLRRLQEDVLRDELARARARHNDK